MSALDPFSHLNAETSLFLDSLYEDYLADPRSVPLKWRTYFDSLQNGALEDPERHDRSHQQIRDRYRQLHTRPETAQEKGHHARLVQSAGFKKQAAVLDLIHAYRLKGHLLAQTDMIDLRPVPEAKALDYRSYGLSESDMETYYNTGSLFGPEEAKLKDVLHLLRKTYCGSIGSEFMHINDQEPKDWLMEQLETSEASASYDGPFKRHILEQLTAAEGIERYLHTKYTGQKRFSLEGGDSLIPMLDGLIQHAGSKLVKEVVIGMAHRGRLNVLTNIMGKAPRDLFEEFEGKSAPVAFRSGDVRYHEGFSSTVLTPRGPVHLALAFNPSHLEIISPVVLGSVRARQDRYNDIERGRVVPVLIHGDAAFAGQGVVYETLSLSQTRGYGVGGSIHIVVNNRIGFTLSNPRDSRSTLYCTDVGKVVQAPIFHVNADDPEAVLYVTQLAVDYRMKFQRDVVIDLVCYRRHGHNEADEPSATQPLMYAKIKKHDSTRQVYADQLLAEKVLHPGEDKKMVEQYRDELEAGTPVSENRLATAQHPHVANWSPYLGGTWQAPTQTGISLRKLKTLGNRITRVPPEFVLHPRVSKVIEDRKKMTAGALPLDWGCAETLAYASLLDEGFHVRISGQDSGRGTFFHRHAVLHHQNSGENFVPLEHVAYGPASFRIIDSILSEEAVLGFEYGYTTSDPNTLVIWEAQFGDFVNVAQVVIDQFITSSEQKWHKLSGLVMFLPHGWEGQGPEHSSARLERFMQLCAQENIQVCIPSSPAQMFHLLRRQMVRKYRKPLVVMTPKSTLRRKISFSQLDELSHGEFKNVIGETDALKAEEVQRIVLCSGKVYYDLLERRRELERNQVAIIRIEQPYPFPEKRLTGELNHYPNAREVVWCQEEPMNMGCWDAIYDDLRKCITPHQSLSYAGRLPAAAPAGGYYAGHVERQKRLVEAALNLDWTDPHPIAIFKPEKPLESDN